MQSVQHGPEDKSSHDCITVGDDKANVWTAGRDLGKVDRTQIPLQLR